MFKVVLPQGSLRRLVAGNTLSQIIGKLISSVSIILISFLIARQYGAAGYGDFVKITTYIGFFYLLADFGLNALFVSRVTNHTKDDIFLWKTLLGLRICIGLVLIVLALALLTVIPFGNNQGYTGIVRIGIFIMTPVILTQAVIVTANALFQQKLRYEYAAISQILGSLFMLVIALVLQRNTSLEGSMIGVLALCGGSIISAISSLLFVRSFTKSIVPYFHSPSFIAYLRPALPLGLTLICNLIYFHADSVILTLTRTTHEVGVYGLAFKVFELGLVVPVFFMNAVYPLLVKSAGFASEYWLMRRSAQFLLGSAIVIGFVVWISAPFLVFIRPDFDQSIAPLRVLLLGLPIFFLSALCMWVLIARRKTKALLRIYAIAMIVNICINMLFIPAYGMMAAAWITILTELFVLVASASVVYWTRGYK